MDYCKPALESCKKTDESGETQHHFPGKKDDSSKGNVSGDQHFVSAKKFLCLKCDRFKPHYSRVMH